jgi:hypothetical protein
VARKTKCRHAACDGQGNGHAGMGINSVAVTGDGEAATGAATGIELFIVKAPSNAGVIASIREPTDVDSFYTVRYVIAPVR